MDKNGKLFGKINIIDLIAILIVVVAIVGIAIRFIGTAAENVRNHATFSYKVKIDDVRIYTVDALSKKGIATDKHGNVIGEIVNIEYKEKEEQVIGEDGKAVMTKVPEKYTVVIEFRADGKESESGYFVGENTELSVGSTIEMSTKYANCSGKIIEVVKYENSI